ncbi:MULTISPECIES: hypothetical protein [unclassified Streptomyces]|uniref:hypothetical protein n=1 Tax=unclassified Streptomyces TaxID=2593676 RepID=UPI0037FF639A
MSPTVAEERDQPPIYGSLVEEFGDVVAEARKTAEKIHGEADDLLDWTSIRRSPDPFGN